MSEKIDINQERAAMTFGMFVMCEAAQMLLARQMNCKEENIESKLQYESQKAFHQFKDGVTKAFNGISHFNEEVASMYAKLGGALKHDEVRRTANEMVRMYIDARNYIGNADDAARFDAMMFNMSSGRQNVISSETRNEFRML